MSYIQEWFEQNYLDGDKIQDGQTLSSKECFQSLTDYHNHIVEKIEEMKLEIPEYRNKRGHHTTSAHMKIRHNKALQMVQSLLQDTNPKE